MANDCALAVVGQRRLRQGAGVVLLQPPPGANGADIFNEHRPRAVGQHPEHRPVLRWQSQNRTNAGARGAAVGHYHKCAAGPNPLKGPLHGRGDPLRHFKTGFTADPGASIVP